MMESHFLWHALEIDSVAHELKTDLEQGLSNKEALSRLAVYKRNELPDNHNTSIAYIILRQIISSMLPVLLLFVAFLIFTWFNSNETNLLTISIVILGFLAVNIVLSSIQEIRSYRYLHSLREIAKDAIYAKVLRNGHIVSIKATELVPGDIICFEMGDQIPADGRIIETNHLIIDESLITYLKGTVKKDVAVLDKNVPLHQRDNMVFMKSMVISGKGMAIVTATGEKTQASLEAVEGGTIVQRSEFELVLSKKGGWYALACIIISAGVGAIVILLNKDLKLIDGIMVGMSLLMAAWPAGLIEAVAMAFSVGMRKLNESHVIIRNLPGAEQLADVELICCNKRGIMTQNHMTVKKIFVDGEIIDVEDDIYDPELNVPLTDSKSADLPLLLTAASMCTNTDVRNSSEGWNIDGDPTEGSLIITAMKGGIKKDEIGLALTRIGELPYDPERKRMSVIYKDGNGEAFAFTRGTVENLLDVCIDIQLHGYIEILNANRIRAVRSVSNSFARERTQSVAFAYSPLEGDLSNLSIDSVEQDMIFIGIMGLADLPRLDTKQAVKKCLIGSIRPILLTDECKEIATGFAKEVGIARGESEVLTGEELDTLDEKAFFDIHDRFTVYADISPSQKTRIIRTLKETGQITAMIGDSANDADAIEEAHIGIAAGETGSSVSINASDIVIMDNSFSTAVKAIEGTRNTLQNAKKILRYFLSGSIATAFTLIIALIINRVWHDFTFPPLSFLQVLWINLVAGIIPAFGIIFNPQTGNTLGDGTYVYGKVFSNELKANIFIRGILASIFAIIVYAFSLGPAEFFTNQYRANTAAMSILVISQLAFAFQCCRSSNKGLFQKIFGNRLMLALGVLVMLMHLLVVYLPQLNEIFSTKPLSLVDWIPIAVAFAIFWLPLDELFTTTSPEYEVGYEEERHDSQKKKNEGEQSQQELEDDEQTDFDEEEV
jgi:Ca2+-transporting ATPase